MCNGRFIRVATAIFACLACCLSASAQSWNNPAGGSYDTTTNWTPNGIPGASANIDFSLNNGYAVNMATSRAVNSMNLGAGTVTFNSLGSLTNGLVISSTLSVSTGLLTLSDVNFIGSGVATINAGGRMRILAGRLNADSLRIGTSAGDGSGSVSGASSGLVLNGTSQTLIGQNGFSGTLSILNSATATIGGSIGLAQSGTAGSTGVLSVGTNAVVTVAGLINAGTGGLTGQAGTISLFGSGAQITQTGPSALTIGAATNSIGFMGLAPFTTFTTGTGPITINKTGSLVIDSAHFFANGNVNVNGGVIQMHSSGSAPSFDVADGLTMTLSNGSLFQGDGPISNGGFLDSPTGGSLIVTGAGTAVRDLQGMQAEDGTITVSAGATLDNVGFLFVNGTSGAGTVIVDNGSVVNTTVVLASSVTPGMTAALIVRNNGSLSLGSGSMNMVLQTPGQSAVASFSTGGNMSATRLLIGGSASGVGGSSASVNVASGSSISLSNGAAAQRLIIGGGTNENSGAMTVQAGGTLVTGSGSVTINSNGVLNLGGQWNSAGDVTVNGGLINSTGTVSFWQLPSGTVTIRSGGQVSLGQGTVSVPGTLIVDASSANFTGTTVVGEAGGHGTILISNGATFSSGAMRLADPSGTLTSGYFSVLGGSTATVTQLTIGNDPANPSTSANVLVRDPGSVLNAIGLFTTIGTTSGAAGSFTIDNGARFVNGLGTVQILSRGRLDLKSGTFSTAGDITNNGILNIGGAPATPSTILGRLDIGALRTLTSTSNNFKLLENGVLSLNGGTISASTINFAGGSFNFNSGTVAITGGLTSVDAAFISNLLGPGATVLPSHALVFGGLPLQTSLMLDGGTLSVGTLSSGTNLILRSGRFNLTAQGLSVGSSGQFAQLNISNDLTFSAVAGAGTLLGSGLVEIDGGTFNTSTMTILSGGRLSLTSPSARYATGTIVNGGLISGTGRINASLTNNAGGIVRADASDHLTLTAAGFTNSGTVQLLGGAIEFTGPITNNNGGAISGHGSLFTGGLANNGSLTLVGPDASIFGATTNSATARVLVTAGSRATFFDPLTNQPGSVFKVSDASVAAFLAPVTGLAAFTGNGTTIFESTVDGGPLIAGTTVVESGGGSLTATLIRQPALIVRGAAQISPNGTTAATSKLQLLEIEGDIDAWTGKLDLNDNDLIIDYTGASPLATVQNQIKSGSNSGFGILSSLADSTHALGYADNATLGLSNFSGQVVDASSVLVKYTFRGDSNLDGQVDVTDLGALATNWQTSAPWMGGDFNYDGFVDVTDLGALATNWQAGVGNPLARSRLDEALAAVGLTAVPEPSAMLLLLLANMVRSRRRFPS